MTIFLTARTVPDGGSLTLHKYVEEFPGLIHFIYIDRGTGRFLAPDMADCVDMLTPDTVITITLLPRHSYTHRRSENENRKG